MQEEFSIFKSGQTLEEKELILKLISEVLPQWNTQTLNPADLKCEQTNGLTNITFIISTPSDITPKSVFLRIFKEYISGIIDTKVERAIFKAISDNNQVPKTLGSRETYRVEEYIDGSPLSNFLLPNKIYLRVFGEKICHFNYNPILEEVLIAHYPTRQPKILKFFETWLESFKENYPKYLEKTKSAVNLEILKEYEFMTKEGFRSEVMKVLPPDLLDIPVIPSHNDIQENNIMFYKTEKERIELIDFEYADYNFRGVDLGCYAEECTKDYTYAQFPYIKYYPQNSLTDAELDIMLGSYLHCYYGNYDKENVERTEEEIESCIAGELPKFRDTVRRFACFVQASWGIWGFLVIDWDAPDFDEEKCWHFLYARIMLQGYTAMKEKILGDNGIY